MEFSSCDDEWTDIDKMIVVLSNSEHAKARSEYIEYLMSRRTGVEVVKTAHGSNETQ